MSTQTRDLLSLATGYFPDLSSRAKRGICFYSKLETRNSSRFVIPRGSAAETRGICSFWPPRQCGPSPARRDWIVVGSGSIDVSGLRRPHSRYPTIRWHSAISSRRPRPCGLVVAVTSTSWIVRSTPDCQGFAMGSRAPPEAREIQLSASLRRLPQVRSA